MRGMSLASRVLSLALVLAFWACAPGVAPPAAPATAPALPATMVPAAVPATPTSASAAEKPQYGGILRLNSKEDPPNYDLHQTVYATVVSNLTPVYNLLVKTNPRDLTKILPDLAERWEISPDGKTYTFYLRKGVKWHDGQPFTSADVKVSFERLARPLKGIFSPRQAYYQAIETIETPDPQTVKFTLKYPQSSFLLMAAVGFSVIFPKHLLDQKGDMKRDAIGTGPYVFKEHMRGSHLSLEKNPGYFKTGLPYLDGILRYTIVDDAAIEAALRTGRIDMTQDWHFSPLPIIREKLVKEMPGLSVQSFVSPSLIGFIFNFKKAPWADVRVRRAAFLAVDKAEHGRVVTGGDAVPGGFMPPGPWAPPSEELFKLPGFRKPTPEDIAEAKRLLAEAGYPDGFKVTLTVRSGRKYQDWGVAAQHELAKVGIAARLEVVESAAFLKRRDAGEFELIVHGLVSVEMDDPDLIFSRFLSASPANYGRYNNPKFDQLFSRQSQSLDPKERRGLVLELQRLVYEDPPGAPFWWTAYTAMVGPRVRNYIDAPGIYTNHDLEDLWLVP